MLAFFRKKSEPNKCLLVCHPPEVGNLSKSPPRLHHPVSANTSKQGTLQCTTTSNSDLSKWHQSREILLSALWLDCVVDQKLNGWWQWQVCGAWPFVLRSLLLLQWLVDCCYFHVANLSSVTPSWWLLLAFFFSSCNLLSQPSCSCYSLALSHSVANADAMLHCH